MLFIAMDMFDLTGKVALITGGGRGLGQQIAEGFAEMGCSLALCSRSVDNCKTIADELSNKYSIKAKGYYLDITKKDRVGKVVQEVMNDFKKVDILINNGGAFLNVPVEKMTLSEWKKMIDVNLTGTFLVSQEVGKFMIQQGKGKIINISSAAGIRARPPENLNAIGYSTSKAAVNHFTRDLAMKWAKNNINVNAISPGTFETSMTQEILEKNREAIVSQIPLNKVGNGEMLKGAAIFLASKASDFVTGHILSVDGGNTL